MKMCFLGCVSFRTIYRDGFSQIDKF